MLSQSRIFVDHRPLFIQAVPYILCASIIMILSAFLLPRDKGIVLRTSAKSDAKLPLNAFLAFWLAIFAWSLSFIFTKGKLYVNWPRLVPLEFGPDISGKTKDRMIALEKGESKGHKREVSTSQPTVSKGILGALFGWRTPGHSNGEDADLVGVWKDGRAHAE